MKGEFYPCKPDIFEMTYERLFDVSDYIKLCKSEMVQVDCDLWKCPNYPHNTQEKSDVIKELNIPKVMGEE